MIEIFSIYYLSFSPTIDGNILCIGGGGPTVGTVVGASIGCLIFGVVAGVMGTFLISKARQKMAAGTVL